ncbi:MAG: hypothetical protein R3236_02380, partial [Phycisphaeraceae bacterium]|nr:hypothetical protein [Phycisphaeraceae bacterium]
MSCSREQPPAPKSKATETTEVSHLIEEREKFDQTVFAMEVRAQTREQFIVGMWDRMRRGDGFSVLQ